MLKKESLENPQADAWKDLEEDLCWEAVEENGIVIKLICCSLNHVDNGHHVFEAEEEERDGGRRRARRRHRPFAHSNVSMAPNQVISLRWQQSVDICFNLSLCHSSPVDRCHVPCSIGWPMPLIHCKSPSWNRMKRHQNLLDVLIGFYCGNYRYRYNEATAHKLCWLRAIRYF